MKNKKISYSQSGVNYKQLDPAKKLSLAAAKSTARNLSKSGFKEISDTRGEAAYVWNQGNVLMASVAESLGTKNLVADEMRKVTGRSYYDVIGNDVVAAIINDLSSVGAKPLVVNAFWAVGESAWLEDKSRVPDLVRGWKKACDLAGASWGGGETPSYNDIVIKERIALGGSAVGIIKSEKQLVLDKKIEVGDRIILIKSTGINANGISLSRAVSKRLPKGYATKLPSGMYYGEAILTETNIYAKLVQDLLANKINIHYISNITGHGLRKVMRGRPRFTYVIDKIFEPQEIFPFIQDVAGLDDYEAYQIFNMGQDYAIYISQKDVAKTLAIIKKNKFKGIDAGVVEKGKKQVIIKPKNLVYSGDTLDLR
jgi:phosphoribosylformylglycinamidine cyclo-ligase